MKKKTKPTHGGKRKGSGRKLKFNEPTKVLAFRVPISKVEKVKTAVLKILSPPKSHESPNADKV